MWDTQYTEGEPQVWQITHKHEGYTYTFEGSYAALQDHLLAQAMKQFEVQKV